MLPGRAVQSVSARRIEQWIRRKDESHYTEQSRATSEDGRGPLAQCDLVGTLPMGVFLLDRLKSVTSASSASRRNVVGETMMA